MEYHQSHRAIFGSISFQKFPPKSSHGNQKPLKLIDVLITLKFYGRILWINCFNLFSPCFHKKNMSPMYLHHKYGFHSDSFIIFSSSSAMNKKLPRCKFSTNSSSLFLLQVSFLQIQICYFLTQQEFLTLKWI